MPHRAIDLVHLARQTGGDDVLEQELLALFAEQCQRQIGIIREVADCMKRADAAHTLKGAAKAVGAWHVADAADAVEIALAATPARQDLPVCMAALSEAAREACGMIASLSVAA
jgi:HPt (histidine-containing phosphotransfer) domain-containing protein